MESVSLQMKLLLSVVLLSVSALAVAVFMCLVIAEDISAYPTRTVHNLVLSVIQRHRSVSSGNLVSREQNY